jgi:predicted MFS family arabinose efflux permease
MNGRELPAGSIAPESQAASGMTAREALTGSWTFWYIFVAVFFVAVSVNGTIAHIVPILTDRGVSTRLATSVLSASGIALIAGRFLTGYLLDRFFAPYVAACSFLVPLMGIVLIRSGTSGFVPLLGSVCLGLGLGAEVDLMAFFIGRYFGLRSFGEIYGYLMAVFLLGTGLGPWIMGVCFDITHSYNLALAGFAFALATAAALVARLGPYPLPARLLEAS